MASWLAGGGETAAAPAGTSGSVISTIGSINGVEFAVGDMVEYNSATHGWISAKVQGIRQDGNYDLDCKPNVPVTKVRRALALPPSSTATLATQEFETRSRVEYYSDSQGGWIDARVTGFNANGTYNLDCKPNVPASKIRLPKALEGRPAGSDSFLHPISERGESGDRRTELVGNAGDRGQPAGTQPLSTGSLRASGGTAASSSRPARAVPSTGASSPSPSRGSDAGLAQLKGSPVQLVRVTRQGNGWFFEVNEDAMRALESCGSQQVSVCTVCGPYRTGKSYLLNLLLGRIQKGGARFRVGSTVKACTEGIWMWGSADSGGMLLMDCEGFGSTDADKTRDAKLMSLCLLISSVFLLNTKGVLNEGLFNALSLVCNLAKHVEQSGQEANKPALLWLLRDFVLELRDEAGHPITPDEYLDRALHARPLNSQDAERSQMAREVRETLLKFFPQRHCRTLVQPTIEEDQLQNLAEVPYARLRPEFRSSVEEMQTKLSQLAKAHPKTIGGQALSAAGLASLLRKLVDALNANKALNIASAWDQVQHTACESLLEALKAEVVIAMQKVKDGGPLPWGGRPLPVSDDILVASMEEGRRALQEEWTARSIGDEHVREEYWRELRNLISEEARALDELNLKLADQRLRAACADWEAWLTQDGEVAASDPRSESLSEALSQGMPARPAARAIREALNCSRMARIRWDGSLSAAKAELKMISDDLASKVKAAEQAAKVEDTQLEQTREAGRLRGQVESLQNQAQDFVGKEKELRAQILRAEEVSRKGQSQVNDEAMKTVRLEAKIRQLEAEIAKAEAKSLRRPEDDDEDDDDEGTRRRGGAKPKCTCNVM